MLLKKLTKDKLQVQVYSNRETMGKAAAAYAIELIKKLLKTKEEINIVFSAAPSQNEILQGLVSSEEIDFTRINAFHMDEYLDLGANAPQMFKQFLDQRIFKRVPFKNVYYVYTGANIEEQCQRYADLLRKYPLDISLLGIGENGHIAFNDPHVADFNDKELIKVVTLDDQCRQQQVNDGSFAAFADVPAQAVTLTIPALIAAEYVICTVPSAKKMLAVTRTISGEIDESCPATILRKHDNAVLFLDCDSGKNLLS